MAKSRRIRVWRPGDPPPPSDALRYRLPQGYIRLRWWAGGQVYEGYEHRIVANAPEGWHVHHINHIKDDNRPENLELLAPADHHRRHSQPPDVEALSDATVHEMYLHGLATPERSPTTRPKEDTMKLNAYLRTSTDSQEEGLETQRAEIRAWAKSQGHTVAGWYVDEGISGSNGLDSRIGLADALASRLPIVVYKLDRLARDLVIQETILGQAKREGTRIFSTLATEDAYLEDDPKDPTRKLIRQVLGAVADYERAMIRLRMAAGANRKKANGGYAGGGIPFGWKAENQELVPEPKELKTLKRMWLLQREGRSLREIARDLDERGLKPRKGERWHPHSVGRILARSG